MQSRQASLLEATCSTLVGFAVALWSQILIFPYFGIHLSQSDNFLLVGYFTIISIARSYFVRRVFERQRKIKMSIVHKKTSGAYADSYWCIVSRFQNLAGSKRVVAESVAIPGLLHIFNPDQLEEVAVNVLDDIRGKNV